ncbi:MAG TPA: STAS domain-containing protein [Novosphingobium sp.]|nr:STAS domain-containing protein [Novosphingobium sp.]
MPTFTLPAQATIQNICALHTELLAALDGAADDICVATADLVQADFSLLQLLVAAQAEACRRGRRLLLESPAHPLLADLLARAGLNAAAAQDVASWLPGECA